MTLAKFSFISMAGFLILLANASAKGYKPSYADDGYNCEEEVNDYNLPVPLATQPISRFRHVKPYGYGYCEAQGEPVHEKYCVQKYGPPSKKYYPTTPYKKEISRFYQVLQPMERYYEPRSNPIVVSGQAPEETSSSPNKHPAIQIYVV